MKRRRALVAILAVLTPLLLAGCIVQIPSGQGQLAVEAHWAPWGSDPVPHLQLTLMNQGDTDLAVGPGPMDIKVEGPHGIVPLHWGTLVSRELLPQERAVLTLHPRSQGGTPFLLSIDHNVGEEVQPPTGTYVVCFADLCERADLS